MTRPIARETICGTHVGSVPLVKRPFPLVAFLRASCLHVGAAAAAAALRRDLVDTGIVDGADFDQAYAVARITPGTNLLAMYTLLGQRVGGWLGAMVALSVGAVVPAIIVAGLAAIYIAFGHQALVSRAMQGARAGALAVLLWAAVRLIRPQLETYPISGALLAVTALVAAFFAPLPPIVLLLLAGALGAVFLRPRS